MNMRTLSPEDYWRAVVSRKWLVISAILVSLSIAGAVCALMPKVYQSATKMWFEGAKIQESIVSGPNPAGMGYSPTLDDRVMEVRQFVMGRKTLGQIAGEFGLFGYENDRPESAESENAIRAMRGSIKVEPTKDKLFITLSFSNEDPIIARDVTSRLSDLFIEETLKDRERGVEAAEDFLGLELKHAKSELEAKEKIISEFKQLHLGELPQQIDANLRKLDRLQEDMRSQSEQSQSLASRLVQIDKSIKDYEETGEIGSDSPVAGASKRNKDPRLGRIKELERRLVELSSMYKETYPDLVQVKEEIRKLKEMTSAQYRDLLPESDEVDEPIATKKSKRKAIDPYHAELLKQREDIVLELDAVKRRQAHISVEIAQYERRVERTPEREQKLKTLERDYENLQKNYQSLLDKKLSAGMQKSLAQGRKGAKFSIVDPAYTPVVPVVPNIPIIMAAGLVLGCALGFGGAVGLELMGRGFRSAEEVEITLGLPVIASIPLYESAFGGSMQTVRALSKSRGSALMLPGNPQKGVEESVVGGLTATTLRSRGQNGQLHNPTPGLELVSMWRPLSFVAEQYRVAATRLELMTGDRKSTAIVVTSAVMGEGKSSTALNLGYVLAKDLDRRTIVIDCDLKRPMQHIYAGVWQHPGLVEVLRGTKIVEDCIQRVGESGPWILPAGAVGDNPLALSKMHQLADLITDLKERFDYVIIDAPPVLPLADMQVLASMGDLLAYVVKASMTGRDVVQKALKAIGDTTNVGIILNGLDAHTTPYYMQQEYYREAHHEQLK